MKKIKTMFTLLLVMVVFATNSMVLFAAEDIEGDYETALVSSEELEDNTNDTHEYIFFDSMGIERMSSSGGFKFSFKREMPSDTFTADSSSITVSAKATSSTKNKKYYIAVYSDDDKLVKRVAFTADGKTYSKKFSVKSGKKYYLYFSKPLSSSATLTGSGKVSPIK